MLVTNGLNTNTLRLIVFCISAFFSGLAGGLMVTQTSALTADTFQPFQSLLWLAVLAICGTRLLGSSILAAGLLTLVPAYVSGFTAEQQTLAFGLAAVLASIVVANTARLSDFFRRVAGESDRQRRRSPVAARREAVPGMAVSRP
jgi:ABC-type branched-subunit amino acid transport system permease subunit